jgi:ankyrin repeat protein
MTQPETLKTDEYLPWSRGKGNEVWAMLHAAATGDLETVQALAAKDPALLDCELEYRTPLHFAVRENQLEVAQFLLDHIANPVYGFPESPVEMARSQGNIAMLKMLQAHLLQRFQVIPEGTILARHIKSRNLSTARKILSAQPELVHAADERTNQPIHWAVMTRQLELIDFLLELGANINAIRADGARPLDLTNGDYHYRGWRDLPAEALRPHEILIGYLLARGAYYDISTAAKIGDVERVRELLDENPSLANQVPSYSTYYSGLPLRCAAGAGHLQVVQLLIERGADVNGVERIAPQGGALHAALSGKHHEITRLLLKHGANPNAMVESSGNCLWTSQRTKAGPEILNLLAAHGAIYGVEMCCYSGDAVTLGAMLSANPRLPIEPAELQTAIENNHQALVNLILHYQPELLRSVTIHSGSNPQFVRELTTRGLDLGHANWLGVTPLHRFAGEGNIEMARVCLESGTDLNAVDDEYSSTPLGWAARNGKVDMARWLLERGAKPQWPLDKPWAQPLEWAKRKKHAEIAQLLEQPETKLSDAQSRAADIFSD